MSRPHLTGKNPNVFYELGLAHAIAKPAILVTESITDVPFDLRALRVIEYDKNASSWGEDLRRKIEIAISEVIASPLQSVLPSFLEIKESHQTPALTEQQKQLIEMRQEIDLLRREMRRSREPYYERNITAPEALEMLKRYIEAGMPREIIAERLTSRGAPLPWVEERLADYDKPRISEDKIPLIPPSAEQKHEENESS